MTDDTNGSAAGFLEADGFLPIFDAVDAMVKATDIHVSGVTRLGGGLVAVAITGHLADVEEAIEIGEQCATSAGGERVRSVIFAAPSHAVSVLAQDPMVLDGM